MYESFLTNPTHPESPRQLLRRGFLFYSYSWTHVFFLALLLSITVFLPELLSFLVGQNIMINLPPFSIQRGWFLLLNLTAIIFFVAILWRIRCLFFHTQDSLEEDLIIGLKKFLPIFVAWLIQLIFMTLSIWLVFMFVYYVVLDQNLNFTAMNWRNYVAFLFVGLEIAILLFIFLAFYFFLALIVLENKGIFASFKKSFLLMRHHWWQTIYVQSIPWITYLFLLVILKFVINLNLNIFFISSGFSQSFIDVIFEIIIFAAFIPWIAITLMIQLKDLELRRVALLKSDINAAST